jgi:hypothetical protein
MSTANAPDAPGQRAPARTLGITLWIVQGLLFAAFAMAGFMKLTMPMEQLVKSMAWAGRFSPPVVRFIGVAELSGALGLLLPSLSRIKPALTPLAALGLLTIMGLAAGHHLMNGEAQFVPINLILGGMAAWVAWGRWKKAPIAAR